MWRVYKESGRPWPVLCPEDDVIDYMVMEAVALKVRKEEEKAAKDAQRKRDVNEMRERLKREFS